MASFCASVSSPSIEFQESDIDKYLQQLQPYTFSQEQGFDPLMRNCKALKEKEAKRPFYEMRSSIKVTGVKELKNIDTKEILRILMEGKEIWTYWKGTAVPETFNQALMMAKTKIWMKNMFECTRTLEKGIFIPHLVIDLCKRAGVPTE
ncbi:hypothetical protein Goshw_004891 [Gossypium schwendimanii]|uniref:Uncharacterized protein n=1 Tax=Gossypium schwendimanii TaxID=34291 RepID=A0A7J9NB20_GOSSC|nr:hypothetical protein [Gossypium schwendimanii]